MISHKSDVSKRILETRKQTEQLREQLQNLRDSDEPGTSKSSTTTKQMSKRTQKISRKDSTKEDIKLNDNEPHGRKHREIYWEQLKFQKSDLKAERKQKLLELHKKAIDIVTRNVQAKRERSKSRERTNPLQPNKNNTRSRSLSRDRNCLGSSRLCSIEDRKRGRSAENSEKRLEKVEQRNPNLLYPPIPNYMERANERKSKLQKPGRKSNNSIINNVDRCESDIDMEEKPLQPINLYEHFKDSDRNRTENSGRNIKRDTNSSNITLRSKLGNSTAQSNTLFKGIGTDDEQREKSLHVSPADYIYTVKQKLKHAVNTHKPSEELKITCSLVKQMSQVKSPDNTKTNEEMFGFLRQSTKPKETSDLKSFPLPKGLNFDTNSLEPPDLSFESDLSRSRESIITFNSPTYNKVVTYYPNSSLEIYSHSISKQNAAKVNQEITQGDSLPDISIKDNEVEDDNDSGKLTNDNPNRSDGPSDDTNKPDSETRGKFTNKCEIDLSKNGSKHHTKYRLTASDAVTVSKSDSNLQRALQNVNTRRGSGVSSDILNNPTYNKVIIHSNITLVKGSTDVNETPYSKSHPADTSGNLHSDCLPEHSATKISKQKTIQRSTLKNNSTRENEVKLAKNVSLRSDWSTSAEELHNTNEVHSKFEAELRLLDDFNDSLQKVTAVEKVLESQELKKSNKTDTRLHDRNTQTSTQPNSSYVKIAENVEAVNVTQGELPSINYSRGSGMDISSSDLHFDGILSQLKDNSLVSTGLEISSMNKSTSTSVRSNSDLSNFENLNYNHFAGMSLRMFEHLIKDEDVRLENLKAILKIREKALLDRTKGELVWLEIQRKHLRETGKLQEASSIKTKQKGILVNHQKEKHEMQRLRQIEKAASLERKIILKEERNLIKRQLCLDDMLSKKKVNMSRERRLSGPLKVVQSQESIRSETSVSRRSSNERDVYSITSHTQSLVSKVSEVSVDDSRPREVQSDSDAVDLTSKFTTEAYSVPIAQMKQTLLMREAALQKRRRAAEELLQWHKKLLEEERRITELEVAANAIISHVPNNTLNSRDAEEKYKFRDKLLNQQMLNVTGCKVKKFADDKMYQMSQVAQEQFCSSAGQHSLNSKKVSDCGINSHCSGLRSEDSVSENIPDQQSLNKYISPFDIEPVEEIINEDIDIVDQTINRLINNFSKINEDILSLGLKQSLRSDDLNKSEEILIMEQQEKGCGDGYLKKPSSLTEEAKTYPQKHRAEKDLVKVNEQGRISTVSAQDVFTPKKATPKESEDSHKDGSAVEDKKETDEIVTEEISEKTLNSFKETNVDEELSSDKESEFVEQLIKISPIEESGHIKESEDIPEENGHETEEISYINDKETELTDQISKEATGTNKDINSEPIRLTESKGAESVISGTTSTEKSSTKASEKDKAEWTDVPEQNMLNKDELSQHKASDVYSEFEETNISALLSKEDTYEEKKQDSPSSLATSGSRASVVTEKEQISPKTGGVVDVMKQVSEIIADVSQLSTTDKSPRMQNLYVTTYDLVSTANSQELGSPTEENKIVAAKYVFGTEAEELLRKELAVEQEIKQITEQQKEQLPHVLVREIPNEPILPCITPSSLPPVNVITIVPTTDEIEEISKYSAKILHVAYLSHNLDNISISESTLDLRSKDITKECYKFVFDLCKEISKEHYKQFEEEKRPSWMQVTTKPQLTLRPLGVGGLEKHLIRNLKELFGYEKPEHRENTIIKWSRKNRDHIDDVLIMESQAKQAQWTNYEKDELIIKNEATNEFMNMLLKETGEVFRKILIKRTYLY